jgi:hypothetical protein
MTLKAYLMVNGQQVKLQYDTSTIGDNLISGKFGSINRITTENLNISIAIKIAIKGSRSTINYKVKPVLQINSVR